VLLLNLFEETKPEDVFKDMLKPEQLLDIIRDLDGRPLSKEYFAEKMGIPIATVESYTCPGEDAFRGLMSNACRVRLVPGGETAFYKHIVFETLGHAQEKLNKAPHKLVRDSQSYQVVASFLLSKACQTMTEQTGVQIPKCYDAQLEPNHENPMESKFSFLFEDFSPADGWYQEWLLDDAESCEAALSTFAKIHAYFWTGSDFWKDTEAAEELEEGVWKSGSYVQPKAQGADQWKKVAAEWTSKRMKFETELSSFDYWDNLGERLESVAEECGHVAHPFADDHSALFEEYRKYRTFTHGDPKQANLLFHKSNDPSNKLPQLGLIDFQWSGFGLAATDIAHFITSAVHADQLVNGGEEILMKYYFGELQKHLTEFGAYPTAEDASTNYSYETFLEQYEVGVLDICRLMIAYTWERFTEPVEKTDEAGCARTMNKTSYNKSISNVVWLMSRCDEILKSRGV
jgi:thiamine kinase-like enzyme